MSLENEDAANLSEWMGWQIQINDIGFIDAVEPCWRYVF